MFVIADLHLTDRERDRYRWQIFPWLKEQIEQTGDAVVLILGDLTDEKDNHGARLVNRVINALLDLPAYVYVLKGNHDYTDEDCPFFGFLGREDIAPELSFISKPMYLHEIAGVQGDGTVLMLPHTSRIRDWDDLSLDRVHVVCTHQAYDGARTGKGDHQMQTGLSSRYWRDRGFSGLVLSGDIHVPQQCGDVLYVGAPYAINFGDQFEPRALRYHNRNNLSSLKTPTIRKWSLDINAADDLEDMTDLEAGDQLKIRIHLRRSEFADWEEHRSRIREIAIERALEVYSVQLVEKSRRKHSGFGFDKPPATTSSDPDQVLTGFAESRGLDEALVQVGKDLIDEGGSIH